VIDVMMLVPQMTLGRVVVVLSAVVSTRHVDGNIAGRRLK
jgi:hypothetical protein